MQVSFQQMEMSLNQLTDETLMRQYAKGDFAAFELLYERNKGGLYRYLLRQLHQESLAEDIFQEVWGKVISNAESYNESAKFTTWLYKIARNKVIDHVRHINVVSKVIDSNNHHNAGHTDLDEEHHSTELFMHDSSLSPEKKHLQQTQAEAIDYCLNKLPAHQLDCFLLREEGGFSLNNIAQIVNTNLEAAKSRLRVAYRNLRICLTQKMDVTAQAAELTSASSSVAKPAAAKSGGQTYE